MDPEAMSGAAQQPGVDARGGQGIQINQGGVNLQVNVLAAGEQKAAAAEQGATAEEFRADVLDMLASLDDAACRGQLPAYLPAGADVTRMTRTVRLLGSVRRPSKEDTVPAPGQPVTGPDRDRLYLLPAERDARAAEPPRPWEENAVAYERLVVLADPGMGKSWLMRTETHRLAQAAAESLWESATVGPDVVTRSPFVPMSWRVLRAGLWPRRRAAIWSRKGCWPPGQGGRCGSGSTAAASCC